MVCTDLVQIGLQGPAGVPGSVGAIGLVGNTLVYCSTQDSC